MSLKGSLTAESLTATCNLLLSRLAEALYPCRKPQVAAILIKSSRNVSCHAYLSFLSCVSVYIYITYVCYVVLKEGRKITVLGFNTVPQIRDGGFGYFSSPHIDGNGGTPDVSCPRFSGLDPLAPNKMFPPRIHPPQRQ